MGCGWGRTMAPYSYGRATTSDVNAAVTNAQAALCKANGFKLAPRHAGLFVALNVGWVQRRVA